MSEIEQTTTVVAIRPEHDEAVVKLRDEATRLASYAQGFVVANPSDVKRATEDLSMISNIQKALEAERKKYTEPLNAHLKEINTTFKTITEPLDTANKTLRSKVQEYNNEQKRLQQEVEKAQEFLRQAAEIQAKLTKETREIFDAPPLAPIVTAAPVTKVYTDVGTMGTRKVWKFEVVDFALLPDEYKLPDMVKIRKVITAGVAIPGVKAQQEDSLSITAKKG